MKRYSITLYFINFFNLFREKIVQQSSEPKIREDSTAVVEEKAQEVPKVEKSLPVVVTEAKVQQVEVYPLISKTFDTNSDADAKSEDKTPALAELDEKSVVVTKIEDMVISPSKAQEVPTLAAEENSVVLSPPKADETMIHLEKDADHHNVIDDDMTSHYTDMGDEQSVFSHSETTLPPGADLPRVIIYLSILIRILSLTLLLILLGEQLV